MKRYQEKGVRLLFRADAAFTKPEVYEYLESRDTGYAIRTIAKSGSSSVEAGDGLGWAEGASLGSQGHGHPGWKPSFQAQSVQPGVDQGGEDLPQPGTAQRVDVLIPTAVLHVMQAVLNAPVVAE